MGWTVETVSGVDAEIEALPVALRARPVRLLEAVGNVGLHALRAPRVKLLEGKRHVRCWGFLVSKVSS